MSCTQLGKLGLQVLAGKALFQTESQRDVVHACVSCLEAYGFRLLYAFLLFVGSYWFPLGAINLRHCAVRVRAVCSCPDWGVGRVFENRGVC